MYSSMNSVRSVLTYTTIQRYISTETSRNLLKSNVNVQKLFCRRKVITSREEFLKMRKVNVKEKVQERDPDKISVYGYALVGIPILCFCLGTWQVKRRRWKNNLLYQLSERIKRTPVPLPENLQDLQNMEYCPVRVKGKFIHEKEFTVGPRTLILDGKAETENKVGLFSPSDMTKGYMVVTPFKLEDRDLTILVNRGWVPRSKRNPETRKHAQIQDTIELTGIVRLHENRPPFVAHNKPEMGVWLYRDVNGMAKMTGAEPIYLEANYESTVEGGPIGGQTRVVLRNEHLSYIITWYSLSALTGWMWFRQNIQKLPLL